MTTLLAVVALNGCGSSGDEQSCGGSGGANELSGSYCEGLEVKFTEVQTLLQSDTFLRVEYIRPLGTGQEKTLQILFDTTKVNIELGAPISLVDVGATVRRVLTEGSQNLTTELTPMSNLTLNEYSGTIGTPIKGEFAITLQNGRTLLGKFSSTLEDAMPGS